MKFKLTIVILFTFCLTNAQQKFYKEYIGDLNGDKIPDKIVIYEKPCEESLCRTTSIFIGQKNGKPKHFASNNYVVDCSDCGGGGVGDPFRGIIIKNGFFSFESLYGACDKTFQVVTFKYDKKRNNFILHKKGEENYSCNAYNEDGSVKIVEKIETEKNFGRITFADYK